MAIIYSYPTKTTPNDDDLLLISDSQDGNSTKKIKISSLPGGSGAGVSSITSANAAITVTNPTSTAVMTSVAYSGGANIGHVPTGGDNTTFLRGDGTWTSPSGTALVIENEGVQVAAAADKINFTGVGVTASAVGNDVTVNIPDAYVIEDVQLASAVSKGTALYISGPAHGSGRPTVDIADATDSTKMPVVGLALENYSSGQGKMLVTGILDDVDTSNTNIPGGVLGNVIYVDNSGVDNNLTGTKPTGTDLIQNVGIITKSGANGSIQVTCIGRTNDLPNLAASNVWSGSATGEVTPVAVSKNDVLVGTSGTAVTSSESTAAIRLPAGPSGDRPSPAVNGLIRYNTTNSNLEAYVNGGWEVIALVP